MPSLGTSYPGTSPTYAPVRQEYHLPSVPPPGYPPLPNSAGDYPGYTLGGSAYPYPQQPDNMHLPQQPLPFSQFQPLSQGPRTSHTQEGSPGQTPTSMSHAPAGHPVSIGHQTSLCHPAPVGNQNPAGNQKKAIDQAELSNYFVRSIACNASGMDTLIAEIEREQGDMKGAYLEALIEDWSHEKYSIQYKKLTEELGIEEETQEALFAKKHSSPNFDEITEEVIDEANLDDTLLMELPHEDFKAYIENHPLYADKRDSIIQERVETYKNMDLDAFTVLYKNTQSKYIAKKILIKYTENKGQKAHILEDILKKVGGYDLIIQHELLELAETEDRANSIWDTTKTKRFAYLKQFLNHPNCQAEDYQYEIRPDVKSFIIKEGLEHWSPEKNEPFLPLVGLDDASSYHRYVIKPRELLEAARAAQAQADAVDKNSEQYKEDPAHTHICKDLLGQIQGLPKAATTISSLTTCLQTIKDILNEKYNDIQLQMMKHGLAPSFLKRKGWV